MQQTQIQNRLSNAPSNAHFKSKLKSKTFLVANTIKVKKRKDLQHNKLSSSTKGGEKKRFHPQQYLAHLREKRRVVKTNSAYANSTIYICSTHNNTIYTLAGINGKTHCCIPTGKCGFRNARQSTSYAAQATAEKLGALAKNYSVSHVDIKIKGVGPGKLSGVRALHQCGFRVSAVHECTPLPHNGCRPARVRRI